MVVQLQLWPNGLFGNAAFIEDSEDRESYAYSLPARA